MATATENTNAKINLFRHYFSDLEHGIISAAAERLGKIANAKAGDLSGLLKLQNIRGDLRVFRNNIAETAVQARADIYDIVVSYAKDYYEEAAKNHKEIAPFEENLEVLRLVERVKFESAEAFAEIIKADGVGFLGVDGKFRYLERGYGEAINNAVVYAAGKQKHPPVATGTLFAKEGKETVKNQEIGDETRCILRIDTEMSCILVQRREKFLG